MHGLTLTFLYSRRKLFSAYCVSLLNRFTSSKLPLVTRHMPYRHCSTHVVTQHVSCQYIVLVTLSTCYIYTCSIKTIYITYTHACSMMFFALYYMYTGTVYWENIRQRTTHMKSSQDLGYTCTCTNMEQYVIIQYFF